MRRLAPLVAAAIALAVAGGSANASPSDSGLAYACYSPATVVVDCSAWNTTSVELRWTWDNLNWGVAPGWVGNACLPQSQTFDADTTGTDVLCVVQTLSNPIAVYGKTATLRIDKTPPTVTGFTADRAPDHDGWFNHPVGLQFAGTDATSGVAGCDLVNYGGPDGPNAPVTGGCRDVAGNAGTGTFPVKYDATPPVVAALPATTDVGQTTINWSTSVDAVQTRVVRSPGIGNATASEVYSGPDHTFTDSGVTGGKTYTYTLTAVDQAANTATTSIDVTAKPAPQAVAATKQAPTPRLRWRKVKRADYYNVQLYRGDRKIMSVWPRGNQLQLKRNWTYRGKKRTLAAGSYHWYVWPGYGRRSEHRYGKLIAHRRFKIASVKSA